MSKIKIAIDVGHGGIDNGTHGGGMNEDKVNLNVALELEKLLLASGHYEVFMTRRDDNFLTLAQRSRKINAFVPNIVISIHHNAGGGVGYDLIYNCNKTASYILAIEISREFDLLGQTKHRIFSRVNSTGADYYSVQRLTKAPCVISEYAFMDSVDVKDIDTLTEQWHEARAIFKGINKFYNL
jgi:N-acetylmuramoyl-L-alanine amidase